MAPKMILAVLLVVLASPATAVSPTKLKAHSVKASAAKRCFQKAHMFHHAASLTQFGQEMQKAKNPGAGLGEIAPFDRVFKDGFMRVDCVKDYMFYSGDKFGDHKAAYELGSSENVSIVHYSAVVAKEDKEEMTPTVCFNFCSTLENMHYFGMINGRDCYCEPYYKAMAGDSSQCEATCPGDASQMCGGKTKSTIFEMHACDDAAVVLAAAAANAHTVKLKLDELVPAAKTAAEGKNELAAEFQKKFGTAGDPDAAALMQSAKESAGKLLHEAEAAEKVAKALGGPIDEASGMVGLILDAFDHATAQQEGPKGSLETFLGDMIDLEKSDFRDAGTAKKGDELVKELKAGLPTAEKAYDALLSRYLLSEPMVNSEFFVKSGNCVVDENNCVMSSHFPDGGNHENSERCVISANAAQIKVEAFNTESCCDHLTVNGRSYSGDGHGRDGGSIHDVTSVSGDIEWYSDGSVTSSGFKVCAAGGKGADADRQEGMEARAGEERGLQYYPAMYFVDKEFNDVPMTCTGTVVGQPIYYKNYHLCAAACDEANQECVGFSYFPTEAGKPNLCFLFSDFKSGTYYTGCGSKGGKGGQFLQKLNATKQDQPLEEEPTHPVCVAKLSKFVGTTLKPNPSGKCKQCMTKLTNAERCWE